MLFHQVQLWKATTLAITKRAKVAAAPLPLAFNSGTKRHKMSASGIVRIARSYSMILGLRRMTPDNKTGIHRVKGNRRERYAKTPKAGKAYAKYTQEAALVYDRP